ncbi:urease subunit gamma/beta [Quadrisphaera granulorum]|uniref:urease n=1 Tax=Quadrisphaera granulorum TaxID=317664 RepID=A0A316A8D5_9ACTN|nr:urease subunit beta [Quadrisphaera granulorum]PWJ54186.1 urease subunit gamma/beta [Quadrisphaera granulorum]SZE96325.1 urease subunit gamma/beta [Quadrisphaera granulorum]
MTLTPRDLDRLTVFSLAELARRRRGRGTLLGQVEAVGLICDEMHEAARDGASYEEVTELGSRCVTTADVMPGVAEMVPIIYLEVSFADGTKLVTVRRPIREPAEPARPESAGSGTTSPDTTGTVPISPLDGPVGQVLPAAGTLQSPQAPTREVEVTNTSAWPVVITSHFHFFEANKQLAFDREKAFGLHLDIPAGASARFEPGETKLVRLTPYRGDRAVFGFNDLTNCVLGDGEELEAQRVAALERARSQGYLDTAATAHTDSTDSTDSAEGSRP